MKRYLYDHGLPFSKELGLNADSQVARVELNKASLIIIDGGVGEGKTTLGIELADYINKKKGFDEVKLQGKNHPQLALGGEQFVKQLRKCYHEDLPVIVYDEAGDFNRRGSLTRFNAMINRTFETYRTFNIIVILCLPCFYVLDSDLFLKGIPRMLLHLDKRSETYGHFKAWSLYRMFYIRKKMDKMVVKQFAYQRVNPNFRGQFLDLAADRSKQLDKISTAGKLEVIKKSEIKLEGLLNYKDLSEKVGRSMIWCRRVVSELRIKHKRVIGRVRYFDGDVANRLVDFLEDGGLDNQNKK